jgi:hypothetical protein
VRVFLASVWALSLVASVFIVAALVATGEMRWTAWWGLVQALTSLAIYARFVTAANGIAQRLRAHIAQICSLHFSRAKTAEFEVVISRLRVYQWFYGVLLLSLAASWLWGFAVGWNDRSIAQTSATFRLRRWAGAAALVFNLWHTFPITALSRALNARVRGRRRPLSRTSVAPAPRIVPTAGTGSRLATSRDAAVMALGVLPSPLARLPPTTEEGVGPLEQDRAHG